MSNPTILEETTVPLYVVKAVLETNREAGELNFRANKTLEYLQQVPIIKKKDGERMFKELQELQISRMKDSILHKIVDIQPESMEELKGVLSAYTLTVTKENLDKIFEVIGKK
jgi:DNA-directed RNA polymerase subunit F